jgi:hypothetical protein
VKTIDDDDDVGDAFERAGAVICFWPDDKSPDADDEGWCSMIVKGAEHYRRAVCGEGGNILALYVSGEREARKMKEAYGNKSIH